MIVKASNGADDLDPDLELLTNRGVDVHETQRMHGTYTSVSREAH